jgi:hypothetical protein
MEAVCALNKQINKRLCQAYPRYSDAVPHTRYDELFVHCPQFPTSLRASSYHPHRDYDLHFEHPATPNTLQPYISLSHDREPLTLPFPLFLTFSFSGRYLDLFLRLPLLVTLPDLCRSSILFERRSCLILFIQVQEYCTV